MSLYDDKKKIENVLQELENEIWSYNLAHFEEVWLCKEGKSAKRISTCGRFKT